MMSIDAIIEGILETMEHCHAECSCAECPIRKYCDEYEKLITEKT